MPPVVRILALFCGFSLQTFMGSSRTAAFEWHTYIFSEDAPHELKALARKKFKDRIAKAEQKYPQYPVQILVGRWQGYDWPPLDGTWPIYFILAGNPEFCGELGCTLTVIARSNLPGWWVGQEVPTNGYFVQTDMAYTMTETRNGCVRSKSFLEGQATSGKPCSDWAKVARGRIAAEIKEKLTAELKNEDIGFREPILNEDFLTIRLKKSRSRFATWVLVRNLEKEYDFRWYQNDKRLHIIVDEPKDGVFFHDFHETEMKWITARSVAKAARNPEQ